MVGEEEEEQGRNRGGTGESLQDSFSVCLCVKESLEDSLGGCGVCL